MCSNDTRSSSLTCNPPPMLNSETKNAVKEMTPFNVHDQRQIPISHLQPSIDAECTSILGVVTLVWPYSPSSESFSLLLVEPDFRLRRERGQVRVHFRGSSAKAVAACGIRIGDVISLCLVGVIWANDEEILRTPGKGIDWELQFKERVVLTVCEILHCMGVTAKVRVY